MYRPRARPVKRRLHYVASYLHGQLKAAKYARRGGACLKHNVADALVGARRRRIFENALAHAVVTVIARWVAIGCAACHEHRGKQIVERENYRESFEAEKA